jgi:hypothetical protein
VEKDRERRKWIFGLLWVVANTFSWIMFSIAMMAAGWIVWTLYDNSVLVFYGILADELARMTITAVIAALCGGVILGVLQKFILRRRFELDGKKWILATVIGFVVYATVLLLVSFWALGNLPLHHYRTFSNISGFVFPLALGIAQWLVLRRHLTRSGCWIAATAVAFGLSDLASSVLTTGQLRTSILNGLNVVEGAIYSVVTLIALVIMLRQPKVAVEQVAVEDD